MVSSRLTWRRGTKKQLHVLKHTATSQGVASLQALYDFGYRNIEGIRDAHEGINGNVFLAALNVTDVVVMQIGFFRQCFLTPFQIATMGANVVTQYRPIFWSCSHIISSG